MKTTIEVTQERIEKGVKCSGESCAVVLAIKAEVSPDVEVGVLVSSALFSKGEHSSVQTLPPIVQRFIDDFDAGRPVKPISFNLDIPAWAGKEGK